MSFEDIKNVLQKFLNPEEEIEDVAPVVSTPSQHKEEEEEDDFLTEMNKPVQTYSLDTSAGKTSSADKFDSLFD